MAYPAHAFDRSRAEAKALSKEDSTNVPATGDWQLFIESVEDYAMFILDVRGSVTTWNRGAEKIYGYAADEIVGRLASTFRPAQDLAAKKSEWDLEQALAHGRMEDEGWRLRKDGSRFWANVVITTLRDGNGDVRGFAKVTRDLTARLQQVETLRLSDERFRLLVETVRDYAIFMLDKDGRVATWNVGAKAIKGYEPQEIIGSHFSRFYPPEDAAADKPLHALQLAAADGRMEDEGWRVRKDGSLFWASVVITALRDERGELSGFAKVTRDLSARKVAEEELRRSEERFRLLIESVVDYAMYMLDPSGRVETWNPGAEALKGYSAPEVIGRHFSMFFPDADREAGKPEKELEIALTVGRFEEEAHRKRKDGTLFWANVVLTPVRDAAGRLLGFAKVTRDLTARAEAERIARELAREQAARAVAEEAESRIRASKTLAEEAAHKAEQASRAKDEFLATVSHELRTPLNAIVGWSALLSKRTSEANVLRGLEVIHRNAVAQGRIIEDILDVSRIINGKLRLELGPADLTRVVRDAIEVVRPAALAREVVLNLSTPEGACALIADAERLQQVMWNLLSNAVKFGKKGGSVWVNVEAVNSSYVVTIADDGQGIAPDFLPFVFDRFRQADSAATRRVGGLGLGLALVRHLVELHGGRVQVHSPGLQQGSTFTIVLPVRAVVPQAREATSRREGSSTSDAHPLSSGVLDGIRLLVLDDEEDARELLSDVLATAGAQVETAASASQGLAAFIRFRPHVVVSDIGMPDEDGYSFMRRIRALPPSEGGLVPALALTAYARTQDRSAAIAAGFTAYLGKPVEPDALLLAVANLAHRA